MVLHATNCHEPPPSNASLSRPIMLGLGLFALVWALVRACAQSIVIDEAETYEVFVGRDVASWWEPASNNHVLNSMLMRLFTSVFGLSHLTVRTPALIGAAIYTVAVFALCAMIAKNAIVRVLLFAALVFNPFLSDFFVAARGYSLAIGFLMSAAACAAWAHKCHGTASGRDFFLVWYGLSSLCAGLSFCANFSFAFVSMTLVFAVLVWGYVHFPASQPRARIQLLAAGTLPALTVIALIVGRTLVQWPKGQLWYGATSLAETFRTVIEASLYEPNPRIFAAGWISAITHVGWFLVAAIAGTVVCQIGLLWLYRDRLDRAANAWLLQLGGVLAAALTLTVAAHWASFRLFHVLLPMNRTAIYLVPLCTLLGGMVTAMEWREIPRVPSLWRGAMISLFGAMVLYYLLCMRRTYFQEWQWDADVRAVYSELALLNHTQHIENVPSNWRYSACLNFYRRLSGKETFIEFAGFDYPAYPRGKRAYVLCLPFDLPFIESERLKIAWHGGDTGVVIAVPVSPSNVHDDIDPQISYDGSWMRDGQFAQAANGTLTYSNRPGDRARFRFEGTVLTWVYTRAFNRGMAEVIIDGASAGVVDQYSPVIEWRARSRFPGLRNGTHDVEIRVLQSKNPRAANRFVDVDLLVVE